MKIRTRITLQFSVIVSVILITFSFIIYLLLSNYRHQEFSERLRSKALNSVKLLADVDEVSNALLKIIDKAAVNPMPDEMVAIYDVQHKLVYQHTEGRPHPADTALLNRIRLEKEVYFRNGDTEGVGLWFEGRYDNYVAVATARDVYGLSKLNYLRNLFIISITIAVLLIVAIGLFFSKQALSPISNMVSQISRITPTNLKQRIDTGNTNDEIADLAVKFNRMLERLDAAFDLQRSFVSNASHELRTPLTALTGQLEVALMSEGTAEPAQVMRTLLEEIRQLNKLSNGLLDLAQANLDISEISLENVRIDELIGLAQAELLIRNKSYRLILNFEEFPEEHQLILRGNEQLLKSALVNTLENACKYSSDRTAEISLGFESGNIHIRVKDRGIGIAPQDLPFVFEPFFRASGAKHYKGHGIGLTLTKKIIELHKGSISISSPPGDGTTVLIVLPHV